MRALLVEDDHGITRAIRSGLGEARFVVDCAGGLRDAQRLWRVNAYDLLILDLGLPDGDGLDLLRELRAAGSAVPVLILTARGAIAQRVHGLDSGADDYLQKPFAFPELLARARALIRRPAGAIPPVLKVGDISLDPGRCTVQRDDVPLALTAKEFAILHYLMRYAGQLVTRSMLLEHCWDDSYEGLSNLVDVHVGRLRQKLDAAASALEIRTVRGAGFILEPEQGG